MARPREFDEEAALLAAARCFWRRGYEATSMRDLAAAMSMTSPSLYNAFGDKQALYRRVLDHYVEQGFDVRVAQLEASLPPRQVIEAFFADVLACTLNDHDGKGCMLVNAALDSQPDDLALRQAVADRFAAIEAFFRRAVSAGQGDGTIARTISAGDLARLLLGLLLGFNVLARTKPDQACLEGMIRPALSLLAPPPASATQESPSDD